jgi:hypothetical protein
VKVNFQITKTKSIGAENISHSNQEVISSCNGHHLDFPDNDLRKQWSQELPGCLAKRQSKASRNMESCILASVRSSLCEQHPRISKKAVRITEWKHAETNDHHALAMTSFMIT